MSIEETGWIASLARHSTHPNSIRIARSLPVARLPVHNFKETPGCGIEGRIYGHKIQIGSMAWLEKCSVVCSSRGDEAQTVAGENSEPPHVGSYAHLVIDGVLRGAFTLEKHWGCTGSLVIDARIKPHHAPPLEEDPAVTRRVDALAAPGGPLHRII